MHKSVYMVSCITSIRHQCLFARDMLAVDATTKPAALDNILVQMMEEYDTDVVAEVLDDVFNAVQESINHGPTDLEIFEAFLDDRFVRPLRAAYIAQHRADAP